MSKKNPFRYFKTEPEVLRMAMMLYVRYPLSQRRVEDLLDKQSSEKFALAITKAGKGNASVPAHAKSTEIHRNARLGDHHFNQERYLYSRSNRKNWTAVPDDWQNIFVIQNSL